MSLEEGEFVSYFNKMFEDFKLEDLKGLSKKVFSLRKCAKRFEIPYPSFRLKIFNYLNNKFGVKRHWKFAPNYGLLLILMCN
jgi:hypothetical protein